MNLSLKCSVNYIKPKSYTTSLKDLFDLEDIELPKLVESNMTNKPMGPSHSDETSIPRQ